MAEFPRYTLKEVAKQDGKDGNRGWIVIYDMVYDVTDYMSKHPGGAELIEEYIGQDATREFDDFGHSSDAKRMLKGFIVGELMDEDKMGNRKKKGKNSSEADATPGNGKKRFLSVLCGKCAA